MRIGHLIKKYRDLKKMNQVELAALVDVSQQTISDYEANRSEVRLSKLERIANVLEIPVEEFFESSGNKIEQINNDNVQEPIQLNITLKVTNKEDAFSILDSIKKMIGKRKNTDNIG